MEDAVQELRIGSEHSIVDWNQYCRDIAVSHYVNNPVQIGGPGHKVEIDESLFSRRKYSRGRILPEQWIFGGYDPATKEGFFCQFHVGMPLLWCLLSCSASGQEQKFGATCGVLTMVLLLKVYSSML